MAAYAAAKRVSACQLLQGFQTTSRNSEHDLGAIDVVEKWLKLCIVLRYFYRVPLNKESAQENGGRPAFSVYTSAWVSLPPHCPVPLYMGTLAVDRTPEFVDNLNLRKANKTDTMICNQVFVGLLHARHEM